MHTPTGGATRRLGWFLSALTLLATVALAETAAELIARGQEFLRFQQIDAAMMEFLNACRLDPDSLEAHVGFQDCRLARGQGGTLVARYDELLAKSPEDRNRQFLAARVRVRLKDRVADLEAVVQRFPDFYEAALEQGRAETKAQRYAEAIAAFKLAERLRPTETAPILGLGLVQQIRGDLVLAQQEYARAEGVALKAGTNCSAAYHGLALLHLDPRTLRSSPGQRSFNSSGQIKAERYLLRAVELDPDNFDARADLASLYYAMRRPKEARKLLTQHMESHPADPRAYVQLAEYDIAEGLAPMAEAHLDRFRDKFPDDPRVLVNLAVICMKGSRYREAEQHLRRAIDQHPQLGSAWLDLGHVLHKTGNYQDAATAFETARHCEDVRDEEVYSNLARTNAALGRMLRDQAEHLTEPETRASQIAEVQQRARVALEAARSAYDRALELQPTHGTLRMELGKVLLNLDEPLEAALQFDMALQATGERPGEVEVNFLSSCAFFMAGELDKARIATDRVLIVDPRHSGALDISRQIERARRLPASAK